MQCIFTPYYLPVFLILQTLFVAALDDANVFIGAKGPIYSVALSPSRQWVTSTSDNQVIVWNVTSGYQISTFVGHSDKVLSLVFSSDSRSILSSAADGTMKLWLTTTGELLQTFLGHQGAVRAAAFLSGGQQVLSCSADGTLKLWNATTGDSIMTMGEEHQGCRAFSICPNETTVVYTNDDQSLHMASLITGAHIFAVQNLSGPAIAISYDVDGLLFLSLSNDGSISWWNASTGSLLRTMDVARGPADAFALSPSGSALAVAETDASIKMFNTTTGVLGFILQGHNDEITSLAFSSDGLSLLSGSVDGMVMLWLVTDDGCHPQNLMRGNSSRTLDSSGDMEPFHAKLECIRQEPAPFQAAGLEVGVIIGIVFGTLGVVTMIAIAIYIVCVRCKCLDCTPNVFKMRPAQKLVVSALPTSTVAQKYQVDSGPQTCLSKGDQVIDIEPKGGRRCSSVPFIPTHYIADESSAVEELPNVPTPRERVPSASDARQLQRPSVSHTHAVPSRMSISNAITPAAALAEPSHPDDVSSDSDSDRAPAPTETRKPSVSPTHSWQPSSVSRSPPAQPTPQQPRPRRLPPISPKGNRESDTARSGSVSHQADLRASDASHP